MIRPLLLALALLPLSLPAQALAKEPGTTSGVVSAADPRAAAAGQEILRKGGSATDAAIAMMLTLNVVEPHNSGIGGGGFLVHHGGQTGLLDTIDGRETAPAAAKPDRFLDANGKPLSFFEAWPGGFSAGVPGNLRVAEMAHAKWGKLPWADLFGPAIRIAEEGYEVRGRLSAALKAVAPVWKDFPELQKMYWKDGAPVPEGTILKNPELAALFRKIAAEGPEAFYSGDNARALAAAVTNAPRNAVPMTEADIAGYQAKERPPVCGAYRVYTICGMGPPSAGGTTVLQILGMVERFDLAKWGKDNPLSWHVIAEAMQLAYAEREKYLADRDFVSVPLTGLIDPAYIKSRSKLISLTKSLPSYDAGVPPGAEPRTASISSEVAGTSHFVAIDHDGDISAWTSTIESFFGSQLVTNGYSINNELTDFTFAPEKDGAPVANRVEAGKRPLSSMSPTIVYDASGKPVFTIGAAGGKTIIMQVAKALIAHLDWGLSTTDSIAMGLIYFNKDGVVLEQGTALEAMQAPLEKLGHKIVIQKMGLKANGAERLPDGSWRGGADPRSPGVSLQE